MSSQRTISRSNIRNAATFFGVYNLPHPATVNPAVLTVTDLNDAINNDLYELLRTMNLAMSPAPDEESAVVDFSVLLLRAMGYNTRGRALRTRKDIHLVICGENRLARTDVCIIDENDILLLMHEDKQHLGILEEPAAHRRSRRSLRCKQSKPPTKTQPATP